jgi:hypothetical protein
VDAPRADPGSFRDPLSRVFLDGQHVWRGLTADGLADFRAFEATSCYTAARARGDLVDTELVDDPPPIPGQWAGVLRHARIDVLSYPYEWSFEMLRDAASLQLRLTREALADGVITKDASAYNVQFVGSSMSVRSSGCAAASPGPGTGSSARRSSTRCSSSRSAGSRSSRSCVAARAASHRETQLRCCAAPAG